MPGTAYGGVCYATQLEAATMWCSSLSGVTPSGVISCARLEAPLPSAVDGGPVAAFRWVRRTTSLTSPVTFTDSGVNSGSLVGCEPYDFAYFSPLLAAFISAMVAILCARWLYKLFTQDREAL